MASRDLSEIFDLRIDEVDALVLEVAEWAGEEYVGLVDELLRYSQH